MQFLYEFFPVLLFFIIFKMYGDIYLATIVAIDVSALQLLLTRMWTKKWDRKQLITFIALMLVGGMTLYFHNPIFVKWKPTIVFWIFSGIILGSQFFTKKPLMQRLMEKMIQENGKITIPLFVWKKLNIYWSLFFLILGSINLYVAYQLSDDAWVNFKFYGITGALLVFSIFQTVYLMRYMNEEK